MKSDSTTLHKESYSFSNVIADSGNGTVIEAGYLDILSGNIYGGNAPDFSYVKSGRGGGFFTENIPHTDAIPYAKYAPPEGGYYVVNKEIHDLTGYKIGSVRYAAGGSVGGDSHDRAGVNYDESRMFPAYFDGGAGGGPVTPVNKSTERIDGTQSKIYKPSWSDSVHVDRGGGGNGARGTDAPAPMELSSTAYGQGGIGGMGGGGGGSEGVINKNLDWSGYAVDSSYCGSGGNGGHGSDGAPGCILVYY